jgi:hypothetical protein
MACRAKDVVGGGRRIHACGTVLSDRFAPQVINFAARLVRRVELRFAVWQVSNHHALVDVDLSMPRLAASEARS